MGSHASPWVAIQHLTKPLESFDTVCLTVQQEYLIVLVRRMQKMVSSDSSRSWRVLRDEKEIASIL